MLNTLKPKTLIGNLTINLFGSLADGAEAVPFITLVEFDDLLK